MDDIQLTRKVDVKRFDPNQPTRPVRIAPADKPRRTRRGCCGCSCLSWGLLLGLLLVYFLAPFATRFAILGIDRAPQGSWAGRSDTIMLVSAALVLPVKLLSVPRDLWVSIAGYGENRINAAHFFAEAVQPGAGPQAALVTLRDTLGVNLRYYARFNLQNFPAFIDALGGMTLNLPEPMAGLPAGENRLDGAQALAFVRSRSDGDDFFRMRQGQLFVSAFARQLLNPATWPRIPGALIPLGAALDTNLPMWLWPRVGLALARGSLMGFEALAIDRSMVTPFVTAEGAQVLLPDLGAIRGYVAEEF